MKTTKKFKKVPQEKSELFIQATVDIKIDWNRQIVNNFYIVESMDWVDKDEFFRSLSCYIEKYLNEDSDKSLFIEGLEIEECEFTEECQKSFDEFAKDDRQVELKQQIRELKNQIKELEGQLNQKE